MHILKFLDLFFSRCRCGHQSKWNFKCNEHLRTTTEWSLIVLKMHKHNHFTGFYFSEN